MSRTQTIHRRIRFRAVQSKPAKPQQDERPDPAPGRIPRVARLMALAIRLEMLVAQGQVPNYAALASLAHVSRARITQITRLRLLSPDIQEALLFLPAVGKGPDPITERDLRPIAAEPDWKRQRRMWEKVISTVATDVRR